MGTVYSKEYILLDWMPNKLPDSKKYKIGAWDYEDRPKNWRYWASKPTIISRSLYNRDYVDGYIWGRYSIPNIIDSIDSDVKTKNNIERAF